MAANRTLSPDYEIAAMLYRMGPIELRQLMSRVAEFLRNANIQRIEAQTNEDGTPYQQRKHQGASQRDKMLTGYEKRIMAKAQTDIATIGVFGRMGSFGRVHDQGLTERRVKYPERNILGLPLPLKMAVLEMIKRHINGA